MSRFVTGNRLDVGTIFPFSLAGNSQQQRAADTARITEDETRHGEPGIRIDGASRGNAGAIGRQSSRKTEVPDRVVGVDLVLAAPDDVHAHFEAIAAASISDVVEILERGEIVQLGSVAAGAYTPDVSRGEYDLRHGGGSVGDVDAWNSHLLGEFRIDVDGIEDQTPSVKSEARLIQPAAAERMRIVQGKALRADEPGTVAGSGAGVAVGQRGRQKLLRTLETIAREKLVLL